MHKNNNVEFEDTKILRTNSMFFFTNIGKAFATKITKEQWLWWNISLTSEVSKIIFIKTFDIY